MKSFNEKAIKESPGKNMHQGLRQKKQVREPKLLPFQLTEEEKRIIKKEKKYDKEQEQEK